MPAELRLAEILSALSLATDLGTGLPLETSLRTCLVASHLAATLQLDAKTRSAAYFAGLLRHLGCTAFAHEAAAIAGDDHDLIRTFEGVDSARTTKVLGAAMGGLAKGAGAGARAKAIARVLRHPSAGRRLAAAQCDQAEALARDLGFSDDVANALGQMYERPDGKGDPRGLAGEAITMPAQLVHAAQVIEALHRHSGRDVVLAELKRRRGKQLAREICDAALGTADALWAVIETSTPWELVLAAEPTPHLRVATGKLADIALAFARFADLKTPHGVGHSPAVAQLAVAAATRGGWPSDEIDRLHLAALFHDLGSVSVGNQIWDRRGPLGAAAWEPVRLHGYHTERILQRCSVTEPIAAIAGAHHERLDGSGYHRGARADALSRSARVLAAADVLAAMTELRPHRAAHAPADAAKLLTDEATAGRLCRDAVALVLGAAGHEAAAARRTLPAGLTEREAEVLGLVARGLATKEIAVALGITPRTVKHHIEHVYQKTQVSTRAAAALFAARHDLVAPRPIDP